MKKVIYRLDCGDKEGQETNKQKKYEDYKKILEKDGEKIIEEKKIKNRFGNCMELTLK